MIPRRLLPNSVVLTIGGYNGPFGWVDGEEKTVRALVEDQNRLIRSPGGEEVRSSTRVYLDPINVERGDTVTVWPDDEEISKKLTVEQVSQFRAPGKSHTVLDLI